MVGFQNWDVRLRMVGILVQGVQFWGRGGSFEVDAYYPQAAMELFTAAYNLSL